VLTLLKEAAEKAPNNPDIRYHYAVALNRLGDNNQAVKQLYLAINSKGNFANREPAQKLLNDIK